MLELAGLRWLQLLIMLVYFVMTLIAVGRRVLFSGSINPNKIVGSLCLYLLLGMIWATLYLVVGELVPGAFKGTDSRVWYESFSGMIYFSYVTLTTLGFGDITPVAPIARFLTYAEAVIGQFYLAIVVASLVGLRISEVITRTSQRLDPGDGPIGTPSTSAPRVTRS